MAGIEDGEAHTNTNESRDDYESWTPCIRHYKEIIVRFLRPYEILMPGNFNGVITREKERDIFMLLGSGKQEEAARAFIDALLESEDVNKWRLFNEEIKKEDHRYIQDIISGAIHEELPILNEMELAFETVFREPLVQRLGIDDTLDECFAKELLTRQEFERVRACNGNLGASHAILLLITYIHRTKDWYRKFLKILWEMNQKELVKLIDPDYFEKLSAQEQLPDGNENTLEATVSELRVQQQLPDGDEDAQEVTISELRVQQRLPDGDENAQEVTISDSGPAHSPSKLFTAPADSTFMFNTDTQGNRKTEAEKPFAEHLIDRVNFNQNILSSSADNAEEKLVLKQEAENTCPEFNIFHRDLAKPSLAANKNANQGDESNIKDELMPQEPEQTILKDKEFLLRPYQLELAESACKGENVIICSPTGSGKTHVALQIISNHMASVKGRNTKVVFLVNQKALAEQQISVIKEHLGVTHRCAQVSGDTELSIPFEKIVQMNDILVVTAQILLDALTYGNLKTIQLFSLLIFDECHHTKDKHPFNCIMLEYLKKKYPDKNDQHIVTNGMPQIVGLTASVGVGKAKTQDDAEKHIRHLCANLDVAEISIVEKNKEELAFHTNTAEHVIRPCSSRGNDKFREFVDNIMTQIEKRMHKICEDASKDNLMTQLPCTTTHSSQAYFQWVSKMFKDIARIKDGDVRRPLESARRYLQIYFNALTINEDCKTKYAFRYLEDKMAALENDQGEDFTPAEREMHELFEKHKTHLEKSENAPESDNPKLKTLHELIRECFDNNPDSRVIVFVKTRDLANALETWIRETEDLKFLNPKKMVGAGASAEKGGMTQNQQAEVMKCFRDGRHKIILATSVAQEGLDVTKCNMVIQYDYNTNEIAMVQARGRARAENSQYAVIASTTSSVEQKEYVNLLREKLMTEAIQCLKLQVFNSPEEYEKMKRDHQLGSLSSAILEENTKNQRYISESDFKLSCVRCLELACFSSEICTIKDSHHVVTDVNFKNQIKVKIHPNPMPISGGEKKGKLHCKNCSDDWGIIIKHRGHFYPVIKIDKFNVTDHFGSSKTYRQWKNVNFRVLPLEIDENTSNIDSLCDNL